MKGTVIEWAPAIIAGVLFAGTVGVVGYNSATNFLYLTNQESAEDQLDTMYKDIEGMCSTPNVPGRTLTLDLPSLSSMSGGQGEISAELDACDGSEEWSKDELNSNCKIETSGFDSGQAEWSVEIQAERTGENEKTITVSGTRIGEAQCPDDS